MKKAFYFILGVSLIILTSATTVSVMTVKPETPKQFIIKSFIYEADSEDVAKYIKVQMKQGWILKSVEGANYSRDYSCWIVVMEKY
jgi:hypothetical protein